MKKFLLLTLAAVGLLAAPKAAAITNTELVNYLDGKICAQIFFGNHAENGVGHSSNAGVFRKTGNNTIAVDNFYGEFTVEFTVNSNNQLVLSCGANKTYGSTAGGSNKLNIYPTTLGGQSYTYGGKEVFYCYVYSRNNATSSTSSAYGNITGNGANMNGFAFSDYLALHDTNGDSWVFYAVKLFVIENNGFQIDDYEITNVNYTFSDDKKTLTLLNLWDLGMPYENTYKGVNGASGNTITIYAAKTVNLDSEGNFTIPAYLCGGLKTPDYYGYKGDGNRNSISYGGRTWSGSSQVPNGYYFDPDHVAYTYKYVSGGSNTSTPIKGKAYTNAFNHIGIENGNYWAYDEQLNGSNVQTFKGEVVQLGEMYFINNSKVTYSSSQLTMVRSLDADITHKVGLVIDKAGYGETKWAEGNVLWVKGGIDATKVQNSDYIDHYELHLVPGEVSVVAALNADSEKGLKNGMNISDKKYWTAYTQSATVRTMATEDEEAQAEADKLRENSNGMFNRFITDDDMREAGIEPDPNGKFTVYLKAVYTDESGLEPTFHALTSLGDTSATGVEDIVSDGADMEDAPAVYYNLNGVQVDGDNLTPGIYVRRQGNTATKIIVK